MLTTSSMKTIDIGLLNEEDMRQALSDIPIFKMEMASIRRITAITHVYQGRKLEPGYA